MKRKEAKRERKCERGSFPEEYPFWQILKRHLKLLPYASSSFSVSPTVSLPYNNLYTYILYCKCMSIIFLVLASLLTTLLNSYSLTWVKCVYGVNQLIVNLYLIFHIFHLRLPPLLPQLLNITYLHMYPIW